MTHMIESKLPDSQLRKLHCKRCGRTLLKEEARGILEIKCPKCKYMNLFKF